MMSKNVFTSCLQMAFPELGRKEITKYWEMALKAELPSLVFDAIVPSLIKLPEVYKAYSHKLGHAPIVISKEQARRTLLSAFAENDLYVREIQRFFTIPAELRRELLSELVIDGWLNYEFCSIGDCLCYSLNKWAKVPKKLSERLEHCIESESMTLYQLHLRAPDYDYAQICIWASKIFTKPSSYYLVKYKNNEAYISKREAA